MKPLSRLYDPTQGKILVDGVDLRDIELEQWPGDRRCVSGFRALRPHGQREHRIRSGCPRKHSARVEHAAQQGGAGSIIADLPDQFETVLGCTFDDGVDLSGGQWQRIALSRGYMRNAQILILDEPTAALDAIAEFEVYSRFAELTAGKTTILMSHRFSTVRMARYIVVLEHGELREQGTHEELMSLSGQYARMFNTQADRYR